jgi:hypothetical protein
MKRITFLAAALIALVAAGGCFDSATEPMTKTIHGAQGVPPISVITEPTICYDWAWNESHDTAAVTVYVGGLDATIDNWGLDIAQTGMAYVSTTDTGLFRGWTAFGGSTNSVPYMGYPAGALCRAGAWTTSGDITLDPDVWTALYVLTLYDASGDNTIDLAFVYDDFSSCTGCGALEE